MKKLEKEIKGTFWFSLILSICAVLSIPGIVIFAINTNWVLMSICIVILCFGFYGLPFFWISFAAKKRMNAIVDAIEIDKIRKIKDLAFNFSRSERWILFEIKKIMQKRYLTGYVVENKDRLVKIGGEKTEDNSEIINSGITNKCPNCGSIASNVVNGEYRCSYCGTVFKK